MINLDDISEQADSSLQDTTDEETLFDKKRLENLKQNKHWIALAVMYVMVIGNDITRIH